MIESNKMKLEDLLTTQKKKSMMEAILQGFHVQEDSEFYRFLTGSGSLEDCGTDQLSCPYLISNYQIDQNIMDYYFTYGIDDFQCRLLVADFTTSTDVYRWDFFGRLYVDPNYPSALIHGLLERNYPLPDLITLCTRILNMWMAYQADRQQKFKAEMVTLLGKPEYLPILSTTAQTLNISGRELSLLELDRLSLEPDCSQQAKEAILACAGDTSKPIQQTLRTILGSHPEWGADIQALLKSKKTVTRILAAQVLGDLGTEYSPTLEEALAQEKNLKVQDAIQIALGQNLEKYRDVFLGTLAAEILKGGKKRKVQWLLDANLPVLHKKDGTEADVDICAALLVSYCQLGRIGRSEPAAQLAAELREDDLVALANIVFNLWMEKGAESKTKWVLAFSAVFGGPTMTQKLHRAITEWPQNARGAIACEAVTALALSSDPAALLLVDSISRKFKFRQVKKAAGQALENAAKELGITSEELADRIVPDLGFDEAGRRVFDYGSRCFTVTLTPSLEIAITNDAGKTVKNMPAPGKTDDPELAPAAYEAFKVLKKQMRTTITAQKSRLELALSSLRCWDGDAWQKLFVKNPIMHQFAISLIWGIYEDGTLTDTFRYMEDGSFNTVDEEEFTIPAGAMIGLAHPVELSEELLDGWKQQLEDYEITQSILQLDRPIYRLDPADAETRALESAAGKMLPGISLLSKLQNLGWYRGEILDAGGYFSFYREDPALGLGAELNFSGAYVGYSEEEDVTVYDAAFYHPGQCSWDYGCIKEESRLPLGEIPPRYYSEIVLQLEKATSSSTQRNENWKKDKS